MLSDVLFAQEHQRAEVAPEVVHTRALLARRLPRTVILGDTGSSTLSATIISDRFREAGRFASPLPNRLARVSAKKGTQVIARSFLTFFLNVSIFKGEFGLVILGPSFGGVRISVTSSELGTLENRPLETLFRKVNLDWSC